MFIRSLFFHILAYILAILLVAGTGVAAIVSGKGLILGGIGLLVAGGLIGMLADTLNRSNRKIRLFLDAIEDQEVMLCFPDDRGNEAERRLFAAFNRINERIASLKMESRRQEDFYKALLQYTPSGIITWDERGQIGLVNDAALFFLEGRPVRYLSQLERLIPGLERFSGEASREPALLQYATANRLRQLSVSFNRVVIEQGQITIFIFTDIGRELNRRESESWDKLTHVLTHEIMNSIAPIVSLSDTLLKGFGNREWTESSARKTVRGLETIKSQGESLMRFTESYRKLSYLKTPESEPFPLERLMLKLRTLFLGDLERLNIGFFLELPAAEPIVNADEEMLSQVLINLLKNSIQALAGRENGRITVRVTRSPGITIEVADNGPGIPPDLLDEVFVPFFTTKPSGTGIGLSLSRQIIRMHGGDLQVVSVLDAETRFIIAFP